MTLEINGFSSYIFMSLLLARKSKIVDNTKFIVLLFAPKFVIFNSFHFLSKRAKFWIKQVLLKITKPIAKFFFKNH